MARYAKDEKLWDKVYGVGTTTKLEAFTYILFMYSCPYYINVDETFHSSPYYYVHCKVNADMEKALNDDYEKFIKEFV